MTVRFAVRYDAFATGSGYLTILRLDTGTDKAIAVAFKSDGTIFAAEQQAPSTFAPFTAPVSVKKSGWSAVTLTLDSAAASATLTVDGVTPPHAALTLGHGGASQLTVGAVAADPTGAARYALDDVCAF